MALKGTLSTVVVTTMVLEGWSTKLNPDIKIMEALRDVLPMEPRERLSRAMERFLASDVPLEC